LICHPYISPIETLQETFNSCGAIKEIRIVKERSGKPKGIAYIDFGNAEALRLALSLDQSLVKGNKINVKTSHPPKSIETVAAPPVAELKVHQTPRARASLIPRAMKVAPKEAVTPLGSNEEFRKKFLGK